MLPQQPRQQQQQQQHHQLQQQLHHQQQQLQRDEFQHERPQQHQMPQPPGQPQPSLEPLASEATLNLPPLQFHHAQPGMQTHPPSYAPPSAAMSNGGGPHALPTHHHTHAPPYPPQQQQQYAQFQPAPAPMPSNVALNGQNGVMRFPLQPQPAIDARQMSGGRHKKEIKRRTKTGCLTCRKRRIKCDEGIPSCKNCAKSKRECLGYDPIFKQQPSPANIQPAPSVHHNNHSTPPSPKSHLAASHQYAAPQAFPGTGGTFIPAAGLPPGEPSHFDPHYTTAAPLDPALASGEQQLQHMAQHNTYPTGLQPTRRVLIIPVDDLFALNDIPPLYNLREAPPPIPASSQQEVDNFYKFHYAVGLDRLFETTWYSQYGLVHLSRDPVLQDFVMQCSEQFKARDDANAKQTQSLEARLVWLLATMPRSHHRVTNGAANDPTLQELLPRLDVVEYILTGQYLDPTRVPPPPQHQQMPQGTDSAAVNQKFNERSFWHHLARFVAVRDDHPNVTREIDEVLTTMRNLLHMLENRDVLYSLAVARHIGGRMPEWHPHRQLVASSNDPNDPVGKLKVAQQFVEQEDQRGTTQVIQRICSMAIRSWVLQKQ